MDHTACGSADSPWAVLIIGAGFGGLGMAIALARAGEHDVLLLEKGADVGGVWRENTYPGAACDVPSHLYSFSFEPNPNWSRTYSPQAEIHQYLRHCAQHIVAGGVAVGVVDLLEMIEIDDRHRAEPACQQHRKALFQAAPIEQAGQRVLARLQLMMARFGLCLVAFAFDHQEPVGHAQRRDNDLQRDRQMLFELQFQRRRGQAQGGHDAHRSGDQDRQPCGDLEIDRAAAAQPGHRHDPGEHAQHRHERQEIQRRRPSAGRAIGKQVNR